LASSVAPQRRSAAPPLRALLLCLSVAAQRRSPAPLVRAAPLRARAGVPRQQAPAAQQQPAAGTW